MPPPTPKPELPHGCLTVAQLGARVKQLLEGEGPLLVVGEVSGFKALPAGHWSFELKDRHARVRVFAFFSSTRRLTAPRDGDQVIVTGAATFKAEYGQAQLVATNVVGVGEGEARARLDALKAKLSAEGLFDVARKRPLPKLPRTVGIVTSRKGEAIKDALRVIKERNPTTHVIIRDTLVQGTGAVADVADAIRRVDKCGVCDVVLVVRGGGAREDLTAFDSEAVARAIALCSVPVVCGVGHEGDVTIADLVADVRAATPSQAAELAVPDVRAVRHALGQLEARLRAQASAAHARADRRLSRLRMRLPSREAMVARRTAPLATLELRLARQAPRERVRERATLLEELSERLSRHDPRGDVVQAIADVDVLDARLSAAVHAARDHAARRLDTAIASLDALSPLAVLRRGWALVTVPDDVDGHADGRLARADDLVPGRALRVQLDGARADVIVTRRAADRGTDEPSS